MLTRARRQSDNYSRDGEARRAECAPGGRRRGWVLVNAGDGWSGIIIGAERASGLMTEDPGQKSRSPMRHEIVHRRAPVKTSRRQERDCLRCCCFSGAFRRESPVTNVGPSLIARANAPSRALPPAPPTRYSRRDSPRTMSDVDATEGVRPVGALVRVRPATLEKTRRVLFFR